MLVHIWTQCDRDYKTRTQSNSVKRSDVTFICTLALTKWWLLTRNADLLVYNIVEKYYFVYEA